MSNILELANFKRAYRSYNVRQERIKREGSPYYHWDVGALAAGVPAIITVSTAYPESKKYEPLDWLELVNNSAENITLTINGTDTFFCVAGTIRTLDGVPLHQISILSDNNVAGGLIVGTLQRQPLTIDKWARRQR